MNYFAPWFVTIAVCWLLGTVLYFYAIYLPVTTLDVFFMVVTTGAAIVVVRGYFMIYSIFDDNGSDKRSRT